MSRKQNYSRVYRPRPAGHLTRLSFRKTELSGVRFYVRSNRAESSVRILIEIIYIFVAIIKKTYITMAVIRRGILGGLSGKIGNVVGSSWKGIAVVKSLPLSVANPNTAAQVVQRTKMTNVVEFAKEILTDIIKPLNDRFASGQSGYNLFVQRNIALFENEYPNPQADLILSEGSVTPVDLIDVTLDVSGGNGMVTYTINTGDGDALATDELYGFVYNRTRNTFSVMDIEPRSAGTAAVANPAGTIVGDTVYAWASFRRADGTKVSSTAYILATVQA